MKLKKLNIESYLHLQGVEFDFTYPAGHAKAGQPLEKICIIGQSATGKTSVLELIKNNIIKSRSLKLVDRSFDPYISGPYDLGFNGTIEYLYGESFIKFKELEIIKNKKTYFKSEGVFPGPGDLFENGSKLIYYNSEIITKQVIQVLNQHPQDTIKLAEAQKWPYESKNKNIKNYALEFSQDTNEGTWLSILNQILEYRKRFTQMAAELINKGTIGDLTKLNKKYENWSKENVHPLIAFAEYFNPILNKLNLEVDLINTEYPIPIKSKLTDEVVPISALSTGTKGLLLSLFPLFELDTEDALVLIDEPERSLFPDMQIDLMQHYQRLAPKAQFVVATHSPFIAAAFEPEERFILYFNEKGKVAVRRGESPIGDDPNDMLRNDFNVDYYNEFGKKAYKDYLALKTKVAQTTVKEEKEKLMVELAQLGDKYNF
jgi:hypothetical protein